MRRKLEQSDAELTRAIIFRHVLGGERLRVVAEQLHIAYSTAKRFLHDARTCTHGSQKGYCAPTH